MAMDIIYKYETKFDDDHKFSIGLSSNNEIQNMVFKERDEWLATGLKLRFKKFEETDEYKEVKKVSDSINKIEADQKNNITYGEIHTKFPNFTSFDHDILTCLTLPGNKTYEYYNLETKKWMQQVFETIKNSTKKIQQFGLQEHTVMHNLSYIILMKITHVYLLIIYYTYIY